MNGSDDRLLAERIAERDCEAFDWLFRTYYGRVENFIRSLLRKDAVAEDLAQDLFCHLWHSRQGLSKVKSFNAYLYTSARNLVIDYLRRSHPDRIIISEIPETASDQLTDEQYFALEKELLIRMAVETFPERRRQIFRMSRFEGMSNAEIAQALGISKKTVENQIHLAVNDLKKIIAALAAFFILS